MVSTTQSSGLPGRLVNFEKARDAHGSRADLMAEMLQAGDPLADAVILEINELGKEAKRQLNQGLVSGLGSLDDPPPAIAAFLTQLETMPEWIDRDTVAAGDVAALSIPPLWGLLTSAGFPLIHTYASPSIAKLLVQTGSFTTMAPRRLAETEVWRQQAVLPGGLLRGAPGYVATVQVRLLHARVRHTAMKHGWDSAEWGVPINQTDIVRTWLDTNAVPYLSARKLGIVFTEEEQAQHYRYWSYLGHLLGMDERLHLAVRSDDEAEALLDLLDSTIEEPDDNSRALCGAALDASVEALAAGPLSMLDRATVRDCYNGLLRHYFGDRFADSLQLPPAQSAALFPLLAMAGAQSWQLQRSTPESAALALEQFTAMKAADAAAMPEDHTAFQKNLSPEAASA
ncbi:oxygenase MpaB family protein [Streptomyces sp. NPDC051001]|uniref:oxygenase MpaB family protein n=1 Tax=Streptomyces sp. NPDC051001 TaxID=3155795 RepID=UPI00343C9895